MCGCSLRLVRIGLGIFYFILFFVCVLCGFVLGCSLGLSLLLLNFVVELVKFISDLRSIKFVWPLKRLTILLRGQNANLLKQIAKINTYIHTYIHTYIYIYIYIYTKKKIEKNLGPNYSSVTDCWIICSKHAYQYSYQSVVFYRSIYKLIFILYFKLQKLEFKKLIDNMIIDI